MHIGPTEEARLLIFQAAELARRTRAQGLRLNAAEATAIACDEMHGAARAGGNSEAVLAAGRSSISPDDLLDGVSDLISEIRLEVASTDGTRLVVLRNLGAAGDPGREGSPHGPGATAVAEGDLLINDGLESFEIPVENTSDHEIRVSSHFPFASTNPRLMFDREAAEGTRLDIPAGDTVTWAPGQRRNVRLVRVGKAT